MIAVEVRNGYKYYGSPSDSNKRVVLNYINMTVLPGSIYGLLGASGCGKTTLLSCIVGQRQLNSGDVLVLGIKPGYPGSGVPGPRLGYMPQEIALVKEMTVKGTIYYFGRIYGLSDEKIRDRYKTLHALLDLPLPKQLVGNCSGGQQRRVSFACAMVHEPELLILDEPTVGLDPVLRERIWDFLVKSTTNSNLAVIITTHYIEEAKQANCIGLMRNGILLAENSPDNIMRQFESRSIEDAFLILSQRQGKSEEANEVSLPKDHLNEVTEVDVVQNNNIEISFLQTKKSLLSKSSHNCDENPPGKKAIFKFTSRARMKALMVKNAVQLTRHFSGLIFMFVFPLLQISCFYLAVGNNPKGINLGIVNKEIDDRSWCVNNSLVTVYNAKDSCEFYKISCRFLQQIDEEAVNQIYFNSTEEANDAALKTDIFGYIHIAHNFSESTQKLLEEGRFIDESSYNASVLRIRIDMSDFQVSYFLQRKLREAHKIFLEDLMVDCGLSKELANMPIKFEEPLYGTINDEFQRFITPGVVMTMIFFLATLTTTSVFITERSDGVWDRTLVAGISTSEMLLAHTISQTAIMILECLEVIFYITVVFQIENRGNSITVIALLVLNGYAGMLFGLVISVYCKTHTLANFVATGAFYPMIILCGILWPLEGMPAMLQNLALTFPFTIPTVSARNILEKGWSIADSQVYNGFLVVLLWILVLFIFCVVGLRKKA